MEKIAPLASRALLRLSGADRIDFLQNLITCDIESLNEGEANFGALLTPQGKILFDFFILQDGDSFLIDVDAEVRSGFAKRLGFYKLRADVTIEDVADTVYVSWDSEKSSGYIDPRSADLGRRIYTLGVPTNASEEDWHALRISIGMPHSGQDFSLGEAFPHEVLMDQFGGVDFTKGCYVGQEVVSRMQHRGTTRNRIVKVACDKDSPLPNAHVEIQVGDRKIGSMGSSNGYQGIASIRLDRFKTAVSNGTPIEADGVPLEFSRPDFATYEWPL